MLDEIFEKFTSIDVFKHKESYSENEEDARLLAI